MPTLNKLEYLDETKQEIKTALNTNFNTGITDEDTFRSYVDKIEGIYDNWPKVTGSGTELNFTAKKGKMVLEPKGNTEQDSYTGKNLCGIPNQTIKHNDVDITIIDGEITLNGTASSTGTKFIGPIKTTILNGSYTLNKIYISGTAVNPNSSNTGNFNIRKQSDGTIIDGTQCVYVSENNNTKTTISENTSIIFGIYVSSGTTYTNYKFKPQLVVGNTEDYNYEPYVGGTASPNPDYPQDIRVVKGDNTIKVTGKNILQITNLNVSSNGIVPTLNSDGSLSYSGTSTATSSTFMAFTSCNWKAGDYRFSRNKSLDYISRLQVTYEDDTTQSFNINATYTNVNVSFTKNVKSYRLSINGLTINTAYNDTLYLQLEQGSTVTEFQPYQEQTYQLDLDDIEKLDFTTMDIELCKIGNVQDDFGEFGFGSIPLNKRIGKVVLDGSEDENWSYNSGNEVFVSSDLVNYMLGTFTPFCNYYTGKPSITGYSQIPNNCIAFLNSPTHNRLVVKNTTYNTVSDFKTWLSNNPVTVYYVLATPETIQLSDATLIEQMRKLRVDAMAVDGTNIITSTYEEGNAPVIINATALMKGGN